MSHEVHIDPSTCSKEQLKQYKRITRGAGKGDSPRNCWSDAFRANYDRIFKHHDRRTTQTA